jgi:hypothetical protein
MKTYLKVLYVAAVGSGFLGTVASAQTDGSASLDLTLVNIPGNGSDHWTVAWVTTESGTFIKSLRKQGPSSWTDTHWNDHCPTWVSARGGRLGSQAIDGLTSATAKTYIPPDSPVVLTWNCRDASNNLMADGNYKFWVQYSEEDEDNPGPHTTSGLLWTKGSTGSTNTYANQAGNFTNMKVVWTPVPPVAPPNFASVQVEGNSLIASGTGPANGTYYVVIASNLTATAIDWMSIATNSFDSGGNFIFTNAIAPGVLQKFYRVQLP